MLLRLLLGVALLVVAAPAPAAQAIDPADPVTLFVERLRELAAKGDSTGLAAVGTPLTEGTSLDDFARAMTPAPGQLVIKERDRTPLADDGQRLLLEIFSSRESEARVGTWQMDVTAAGDGARSNPRGWRVTKMERLSSVTGLYRLGLDLLQQFDVRNLTIKGPDLALEMSTGNAFVATTPEGPTALVLMGRGRMTFSPQDPAEQTQIRIFAGDAQLTTDFDALMVRLRPADYTAIIAAGALTPRAVAPDDARRATRYFEEHVGRSFSLDLNDMSRERWSLLPQPGDLIAEIRTKRFGNLTYARVRSDAEDVTLFDRRRRKNISVYASREKLGSRGRFYSEDDLTDYDVLAYDLEADVSPERLWIDGRARLTLTVVSPVASGITLKIAEPLAVRSVSSRELGRLMYLRVVGQNSVIVNFPVPVTRGTTLNLLVVYGGRVEAQELDREAITLDQEQELIILQPEERYVYSNRSYWYPQSTVGDYATARIAITIPPEYDAVASGAPVGPPVAAPGVTRRGDRPRRTFTFIADNPLRYLSFVVSRFNQVTTTEIALPSRASVGSASAAAAPADAALSLIVKANPRQTSRGRGTAERSAAILQFYASLMGDAPYPALTVALSESHLPGGHSPAYVVLLNQTLPTTPLVWRNDPVSFDSYPTFFLAHELAHQWWGQAVGWKNYHEQWISEGFAQYFATMYAEEERGADTFASVLRQMRRWAIDASDEGPIYLGYRLGHIKSDSRVFRAILYNKSAVVLHMLRRLVGDDAFFDGLRSFYAEWRFRKAGTDDFRRAMERASGQKLEAFFDAWIFRSEIPRVQVSHAVEEGSVTVRVEQRGAVVPLPVSLTLVHTDGTREPVVVASSEPLASRTFSLKGALREVIVHQEQTLAVFER